MRIRPAKTLLEPNISHSGPLKNRRRKVAISEMMLELAISVGERLRSFLMVTVRRGGNVYLWGWLDPGMKDKDEATHQAQNASMNPSQEKKKTRP